MTMTRTARILALCLCCALAGGSICDSFTISFTFVTPERVEATDTQTVAMPDGAKLVVNNENGSTRVTVDPDATQATIEITRVALGDDEQQAADLLNDIVVTVTEPTADNNVLRVDAPKPDSATGTTGDLDFDLVDDELSITGIVNSRRVAIVTLRITIPAGHAVDVTNHNGAIRAVDLDTPSTLTSHNGSIRTIDATTDVTIDTNNGSVHAEGHRGSLDAETHNGSLHVEIRTLGAGQRVDLLTHNGRVNLDLPADIDADLSAETDNGTVEFDESDFDNYLITIRELRRIAVTLNNGGPVIDVETHNGRVDIDGD